MTGYLLDDPMFMVDNKERKEKVDKVFSEVEQLEKDSKLSDRYTYIVQLTICTYLCMYMKLTLMNVQYSQLPAGSLSLSLSVQRSELTATWYFLFWS